VYILNFCYKHLINVHIERLAGYRAIGLLALVLPLSGCLFSSHKVQSNISSAQLKTASKEELIQMINSQAAKIQTLLATVDIDTSVGGAKRGKVTEYKEIRGYVLVRKPSMLRMIGLMPIVRNRAFDMVSDGENFKLWIPPKNKFIVGRNNVVHPSTEPLANIRPQQIYDSLLLRAIDPDEIAILENGSEMTLDKKNHRWMEQADYELDVIRHDAKGWYLDRKIVIDRTTLQADREFLYDQNGNVVTDTRYKDFKDYAGTSFPSVIQIWRPQEEYSIVLTIVKLQVNGPIKDEQFALQQPPGSQLERLDQSPQTSELSPGQQH
jgi:outer membrane lipoprotein-sorting protein